MRIESLSYWMYGARMVYLSPSLFFFFFVLLPLFSHMFCRGHESFRLTGQNARRVDLWMGATRGLHMEGTENNSSIIRNRITLKPHRSKNKSPFRHGYGKAIFFAITPIYMTFTLYARRVASGLELPPTYGGIVLTGGSNL